MMGASRKPKTWKRNYSRLDVYKYHPYLYSNTFNTFHPPPKENKTTHNKMLWIFFDLNQ